MRKIVVELSGSELAKRIESNVSLRRLRSFELLHLLRYDQKEFVGICRIVPKNPRTRAEDCFRGDPATIEIRVLRREADSSIVLLRRPSRVRQSGFAGPFLSEVAKPESGYLLSPLRYRDGKLTFTVAGNQRQIRALLARARQQHLPYRVLSLREAEFSGSLLDRLTRRQTEVLQTAYDLGYYDVPRRITSEQLARGLGVRAATVVEHLRKSEKRLLDAILLP